MKLSDMDKDQLMDLLIVERVKNQALSPENVIFNIENMQASIDQDLEFITSALNGYISYLEVFKEHILGRDPNDVE